MKIFLQFLYSILLFPFHRNIGWLADLTKPDKSVLNDTNDDGEDDEDFNYTAAAAEDETEVDCLVVFVFLFFFK